MDETTRAIMELSDEEAEYALSLRGDLFWDYLRSKRDAA